ncbi:MAG: UDP-N-acetylmuramoyl-tripeptide--D-alanyl-D-alanine ligase [Candidatus Omnitrophica bacterium]|nr:UDP-N-acetylmuramoyl-tripeptide--D-alanyl-D-alanine ligase [Candidatus Omnitrophota bacterium]
MRTASELAALTRGELLHGEPTASVEGISIDSRTLQRGEAFVAIRGTRCDGHDFLGAAAERGASALLIERGSRQTDEAARWQRPVIAVEDGVRALGALARHHRQAFGGPVIAVTGSCGKTTTKDCLARLLSTRLRTLASQGTYNNHIGVPLTLLALRPEHEAAVIELGSNHAGEIAYLASLVEPTQLIITSIGASHLEFFGSIEAVAQEKWSAVESLRPGGAVILPGEELHLARLWDAAHPALAAAGRLPRLVTFGTSPLCDVSAEGIAEEADTQRFHLRASWLRPSESSRRLTIHLPGRHNVTNALAAVACAGELGCSLDQIAQGLMGWRSSPLRMERLEVAGVLIWNDCYNANPQSMAAAIETLACAPARGRRILICGEMLELGDGSPRYHRQVGRLAAQQGIDAVIAVGRFARDTIAGCRLGTDQQGFLKACATLEQAAALVEGLVAAGDVVLIKGSRLCRMERLTQRLQERLSSTTSALISA